MSQVRKTTFITLVFMFSAGLLSGCGISGPLYAPGTGPDAKKAQQIQVATPVTENVNSDDATGKTSSSEAE
ncbi:MULTISPECIES: lipoprotein [unclassified Moritella]|uniref:LPS translocon maturation chaperone LptM n=1 Tax=unclassified Moritella TaxID=2637987 RepID=UPI001BA545D1|nr:MULTISPECIES: lipoprotein [unclassified Moritella]QUM87013.1 lipoprotein [Moritella sp. 28]QUM91249.1 lipoprotein [Moritella sp. 36]